MQRTTFLAVALLAGCVLAPDPGRAAAPSAPAEPLVLGTFDSRVLAIAYYRSEAFERSQQQRIAAYERAKAAGDAAATAAIEREMEERQKHVHRQGFSTAPIPELLAQIGDRIPEVARSAGVQAVVCKWDLVWLESCASTVDLSLQLAELFEPDGETRKLLPEVLRQKPVPMDELERHGHDH
jgi:hypothetical protein